MELWYSSPTLACIGSIIRMICTHQGIVWCIKCSACKPSEPGVVGSNPTGPAFI